MPGECVAVTVTGDEDTDEGQGNRAAGKQEASATTSDRTQRSGTDGWRSADVGRIPLGDVE